MGKVGQTLYAKLELSAGHFTSLASLTVSSRLYLSDFPVEDQSSYITLPEASRRRGCTRQWIEYQISQGTLHAYYDAVRRQKVLRSTDV